MKRVCYIAIIIVSLLFVGCKKYIDGTPCPNHFSHPKLSPETVENDGTAAQYTFCVEDPNADDISNLRYATTAYDANKGRYVRSHTFYIEKKVESEWFTIEQIDNRTIVATVEDNNTEYDRTLIIGTDLCVGGGLIASYIHQQALNPVEDDE